MPCFFEQLCSIAFSLFLSYLFYVLVIAVWILYRCFRNHVLSKIWKVDLKVKYGPWAVVTGCTDGIGEQYAYELAKRGMNIILMGIPLNKLNTVSSNIRSLYGVQTEIIEANFKEGVEIYKELETKLKGKDIGILANIAGVNLRVAKSFDKVDQEDIWAHVSVNIAAPTYLTNIVLPTMLKNKRGAVINVASAAAMTPSPFAGIYSASKAYIYYFTLSSNAELKDKGIFFQTIAPSYVATSLIKFTRPNQKPGFWVPSPQTFAAEAVSTIGYSNFTCGYFPHELLSIIYYIAPQWIVMLIAIKWRSPLVSATEKNK